MSEYKAIATRMVSVEPGKVTRAHPNKNVSVQTESLGMMEGFDPNFNCIVASFESGPEGTLTEHAFKWHEAEHLLLDLVGSLAACGHPLALMMADQMPNSIEEIPEEYREHLPNKGLN